MLSEQITVTTAAISIRQLIATARGIDVVAVPNGSVGVLLRYATSETQGIILSDAGSSTGAAVLDGSQSLFSNSWTNVYLANAFLKAASSSVTVHVIVEQDKRG